jgi:hypothetical protein
MRIVKMEFQEEGVEKFLSVFDRYKEKIASAAGCLSIHPPRATLAITTSSFMVAIAREQMSVSANKIRE